jgi:hypothetical protein
MLTLVFSTIKLIKVDINADVQCKVYNSQHNNTQDNNKYVLSVSQ